MMKFAIITVCYNAQKGIEDTIRSVLSQTYRDFEYLIIDGQSTDETLNIVRRYAKDSRVRVYSEKDDGIYDAMNKGAKLAKAEYVIYMNAGDYFCGKYVLEDACKAMSKRNADVYYGSTIVKRQSHFEYFRFDDGRLLSLIMGNMPCHQSVFAKRNLLVKYQFDLNYKIRADYKWLLRMQKRYRFQWIPMYVSVFLADGVSSRSKTVGVREKETKQALREEHPILQYLYPLHRVFGMIRNNRYMMYRNRLKKNNKVRPKLDIKTIKTFFLKKDKEEKSDNISKSAKIIDSDLKGANRISANSMLIYSHLGYGSYLGDSCCVCNTYIGKYTSIGSDVRVIHGNHPLYSCISTSPCFYSRIYGSGLSYVANEKYYPYKHSQGKYHVTIGNDVWIGDRVSIMEGVTIGDGAVIGACSLVTKDVEPYTVCVGSPAHMIKKRFTDEQIEVLLSSAWWNKPEKWIRKNAQYFMDIDRFINILLHEN